MTVYWRIIAIFLFIFQQGCFLQAKKNSNTTYIVTSFSVLEDVVKNLLEGCQSKHVVIKSIVPVMNDPHVYELKPQDIILLQQADFIILNGIGFEQWLERIIQQKRYHNKFMKASDVLPLRLEKGQKVLDPHMWHDVENMMICVDYIAQNLINVLPKDCHIIEANKKEYQKKLQDLNTYIKQLFLSIPEDKRFVITTHDAFWYFGKRYGLTFLAPIGLSTEEEPTPQKISQLIDFIKRKDIRAIFIESLSNAKQINKIAQETGQKIGGVLYADSLSAKEGQASNYIDMMRYNAETIFAQLS